MMAGFTFRYRISGGQPTVQSLLCKDNETLTKGDIANLETGELDLGATADTNLVGAIQQTAVGVDSTTRFEVITDADAVYGVTDANARLVGATLDLSGATGAQTVATSSNKEFVVVAESSATEETLVRINIGKHFANKAQ
jgi:uncharacterized Zn finger protein